MEYKIAVRKMEGPGWKKETVWGELVAEFFAVHDDGRQSVLTHIGTGRSICRFNVRSSAVRCAKSLRKLDLPWDAKTMKDWEARADQNTLSRAVTLIKALGGKS